MSGSPAHHVVCPGRPSCHPVASLDCLLCHSFVGVHRALSRTVTGMDLPSCHLCVCGFFIVPSQCTHASLSQCGLHHLQYPTIYGFCIIPRSISDIDAMPRSVSSASVLCLVPSWSCFAPSLLFLHCTYFNLHSTVPLAVLPAFFPHHNWGPVTSCHSSRDIS
jgi:hypothetical protein